MNSLLHRMAWIISALAGILLAFMLSDAFSGAYDSAFENFWSWGWFFALFLSLIFKRMLLSENTIDSLLSSSQGSPQDPGDTPPISPYEDARNTAEAFVEKAHSIQGHDENITPSIEGENHADHIPEIHAILPEEPKKPNWLVVFFSDRPLAKIGGILLFLGVLFFLSLVWTVIGNVGKILIGLLFGFSLYALGVWMEKKGHTVESRTLLGVGIAINTLTILSGRWIIGSEGGSAGYLSDSITLVFLLLNTLFAVVTALVYTSRTFLIFSFVFAYLIPFLIGSSSSSTILMLLYILIVSLGGYLLSYFLSLRENMRSDALWLFLTVTLGSLILIILTSLGLHTTTELITYVVILLLLTLSGILIDRKNRAGDNTSTLILGGYIALAFSIFQMDTSTHISLFILLIGIIPFMVFTVLHVLVVGTALMMAALFFAPLILALFLLGVFGTGSVILLLISMLLFYSIASFFVLGIFSRLLQYCFFLFLGGFMFICSVVLDIHPIEIASIDRLILALSILFFFCFSLWNALSRRLDHLLLLSGAITAILFAVILDPLWSFSWVFYALFLFIGFMVPFLTRKQTPSLPPLSIILYQVLLNLFMIGEMTYLGKNLWFSSSTVSLITLGLIFFGLSVASLVYSLMLIRSSTTVSLDQIARVPEEQKNMMYGILAIPLSLFSLSIAVIFSDNPSIVAAVWILESAILAFLSSKISNIRILIASSILLLIGLLRLIPFFDMIQVGDWMLLVPLSVILGSLFVGVQSLTPRKSELTGLYDVLHIIGVIAVGCALMKIIPHSSFGWSILGTSLFLAIATVLYARVDGAILSKWLVVMFGGYFLYHIARMDTMITNEALPVLVQLSGLALAFAFSYVSLTYSRSGKISFTIASVASVFITSLYVNSLTHNVFAVTIYLTLLSTGLILYGINTPKPPYRTAGLYIGTAVLLKILFYDLWIGVDNLIIRVVALMVSGGVMIGLSQLYGRSVSRGWAEEFSPLNFRSEGEDETESIPFTDDLARSLLTVDISHISSIRLLDHSGLSVFESRRSGILRIVSSIIQKMGKNQFAPNELATIFQKVIPSIRSTLPKKDLASILASIGSWIEQGGSVDILYKNQGKN